MLGWFKSKPATAADKGEATRLSQPLSASAITWRKGTTLPIPDWQLQHWPAEGDKPTLDTHANALAAAWLDTMAQALPGVHTRMESANFMLLSSMAPRPARALLDYVERSRRRVLATLPGIAGEDGHGKIVMMVFGDEESYYRYVTNYGSASSEPEAFSAGMFIDAGYGHFVFAQAPFENMEPVVVHELTHCLLRHLPIPAWLNEGLAVNTEHRFSPQRPRYGAEELRFLLARFWNGQTIQEFWSGKSFLRPDDGQPLSYELAKLLVQLVDKDYDALTRFCIAAQQEDGGEAAAVSALGLSLQDLATVVLGPGNWAPQPALWMAGTEKGQF